MKPKKTWALVTNGVRARILRELESDTPSDPLELISKAAATHLRDMMTDKAGRTFSSDASGRRAALEPGSDPIRRDMQEFAQNTLALLQRHHRDGDFAQLAIFAAPKMLGILRQEMPASLQPAIILERPSNLIQVPEFELRQTVRRLLLPERAN